MHVKVLQSGIHYWEGHSVDLLEDLEARGVVDVQLENPLMKEYCSERLRLSYSKACSGVKLIFAAA